MRDRRLLIVPALVVLASLTAWLRAGGAGGTSASAAAPLPQAGEAAPDFALPSPAGETVKLSDLCANRPVVVEFGSLSSPVFRSRVAPMERLKQAAGTRASFLVVYTLEAHPADVRSPYADAVWLTEQNQRQGIEINQPKTCEERMALAQRLRDLGMTLPVVVDGMDNAVWKAWGSRANSGFLVGADGKILASQAWIDPVQMGQALDAGAPSAPPPAGVPAGAQARLDVQYGEADATPLFLDAYTPAGAGPFPAVLMLHGGGWKTGDKCEFNKAIPTYLAQGIACFAVNYRLSDQAPYPAAVDDCLAAVRWVRQQAAEFHVDPDRIAVMGGSSGGHLALMVATTRPGAEDVDSQGQPLKSLVAAVASLSGPTDLRQPGTANPPEAPPLARSLLPQVIQFLGGRPSDIPEKYAEASPLTHVSGDVPPALLLYGLDDTVVPPGQGELMAQRLKDAGAPVQAEPLPAKGHGVATQYALPELVQFLVDHLK